jgi:hypothetical protein
LTDVVATDELTRRRSELSKATENPFEQGEIWCFVAVRLLVYPDITFVRHVTYQHPRNSEGDPQASCDFRDGSHVPAHGGNRLLFQRKINYPLFTEWCREDKCLDGKFVP